MFRFHHRLSLLPCFGLLITLSSCSGMIMGMYGMHQPKSQDALAIEKKARKYGVPEADSYQIDTAYLSFLFSYDTVKLKEQIKNHYQPLQVLYYNEEGYLQSFHVNCFAGGFPNLDWNREGEFDRFVPRQQAEVDTLVSLKQHLEYLKPLSGAKPVESYEHTVLVHWNRFMGRQSKRLIELVQENAQLATPEQAVRVIYVNTDNLFIDRE